MGSAHELCIPVCEGALAKVNELAHGKTINKRFFLQDVKDALQSAGDFLTQTYNSAKEQVKKLASGLDFTRYSIGTVDFYPNGGQHQPGCPEETYGLLSMVDFEGEKDGGACSHGRAVDFFVNSINRCRYNPPTGGSTCTMGFHTSLSCRGDHYPTTTATAPFC